MESKIKVLFGQFDDMEKIFVVIAARFKDKWIFVRHKQRNTYEIAGGHIEKGEDIFTAAKRELYEETGAIKYTLDYICDYAVDYDGVKTAGCLFYANIDEISPLPDYEIAEVKFFDILPSELTYPQIQPHLHHKVQVWLSIQSGRGELWDIYDKDRNKTGRIHTRGEAMAAGDYHLVIHAWIRKSDGKFLITQRAGHKGFPFMWESVGGSALMGETSLQAALRETEEETGLKLNRQNGKCLFTITREDDINDIWLFTEDFDYNAIKLQENETVAAKIATLDEIKQMIAEGVFVPYSYIDKLP